MNCELTYKTARANAKSTLLGRGVIDKFNTILDYSLFTKEANKFWQYAKDNYLSNLPLEERLITSEDNKVIFNDDAFMRIDASKGVIYPANEKYQNDFDKFTSEVFYQLSSTRDPIKDINEQLEKFLSQFGFSTEQVHDLKNLTPYSIIGATDFLEKTIFVQKDKIKDAYTKEAAYVIFNLLGKKNLLRKDLIASIHLIDRYEQLKSIYANSKLSDYQIRELIAIDYLQLKLIEAHKEVLKTSNKAVSEDVVAKNKLDYVILKIKQWWSNIVRRFLKSYKKGYIEDVFNQIANDVINNNTRLFNLPKSTTYSKMELYGKFKEINTELVKLGAINSGSYSLNKQGTLSRVEINDLDYFVPYEIKDKFLKDLVEKYPQAKFGKPFTGVMGNRSVTLSVVIDNIKIDFFLPTTQKESDNNKIIKINGTQYHYWKNIFDAKIRIGSKKHLSDLAGFIPFVKNKMFYEMLDIRGQRHFNFNFIKSKFNSSVYSSDIFINKPTTSTEYSRKELITVATNFFKKNNININNSLQYKSLLDYFKGDENEAKVSYFLTFSENFIKFFGKNDSRNTFPKFIIESVSGNYSKPSILRDKNGEPIVFYHGAGTKFDKFSKDYFLSGEGAMAYGAGFYATNFKPTADNYRDTSKAAIETYKRLLQENNEPLLNLLSKLNITLTEENIDKLISGSDSFEIEETERVSILNMLGITETKALYISLTNPLYWEEDILEKNKRIIEEYFGVSLENKNSGKIYRELEKKLNITDVELSARLYQIGIDGVVKIAHGGSAAGGFSHTFGEIHVIFFEPIQAKSVNNSGVFSIENENTYDPLDKNTLTISESYEQNQQKTILPIDISVSLEEETFNVGVLSNNKKVGFIRGEVDGTYLTIETTELESKKGYGTESYKQLGNWANKNGLILRSDKVNRMNEGSTALWEKLIREGFAIKTDRYEFSQKIAADIEDGKLTNINYNADESSIFRDQERTGNTIFENLVRSGKILWYPKESRSVVDLDLGFFSSTSSGVQGVTNTREFLGNTLKETFDRIQSGTTTESDSFIISFAIAERLLQTSDQFVGRVYNSLKTGVALTNEVSTPILYWDGVRVVINVNRVDKLVLKYKNYIDFINAIDLILTEEVLHGVVTKVTTRKELETIYDELSDEEKEAVKSLYRFSENVDKEHFVQEYLRMILQDRIFGTSSEGEFNIRVQSIFRKVLDYLKEVFKLNPTRKSQEIVNRIENYINNITGQINNQYFQQDTTNQAITEEVKQQLISFLKTVNPNFKVESIEGLGYNGLLNLKEGLIQLESGKELIALPEEVAHVFVELLPDTHWAKKEMLDKIRNTPLYKETYEAYKDIYVKDGKPDIEKIKKEAIGKAIAQKLAGQEPNLREHKNLLDKIIDSIRKLLSKYWKQLDAFSYSVDRILNQDVSDLSSTIESGIFYQLSQEQILQAKDSIEKQADKKQLVSLIDKAVARIKSQAKASRIEGDLGGIFKNNLGELRIPVDLQSDIRRWKQDQTVDSRFEQSLYTWIKSLDEVSDFFKHASATDFEAVKTQEEDVAIRELNTILRIGDGWLTYVQDIKEFLLEKGVPSEGDIKPFWDLLNEVEKSIGDSNLRIRNVIKQVIWKKIGPLFEESNNSIRANAKTEEDLQHLMTEDRVMSYFEGKSGDVSAFESMFLVMENQRDPVLASMYKVLTQYREKYRLEASILNSDFAQKINPLLKDLGDREKLELTEVVDVVTTRVENGEIITETHKEKWLISEHDPRWKNELKKREDLLYIYKQKLEQEYNKENLDQYRKARLDLEKWKAGNMYQEYSDEYYSEKLALQDETYFDILDIQTPLWNQIGDLQELLSADSTPEEKEAIKSQISSLRKKVLEIENLYKPDGSEKEGREKELALKAKEKSEFNRKYFTYVQSKRGDVTLFEKALLGKFVEVLETVPFTDETKDSVTSDLNTILDQIREEPIKDREFELDYRNLFFWSQKLPDEFSEFKDWVEANIRTQNTDEFFTKRARILQELKEISNSTVRDDRYQLAEEIQFEIDNTYEKLLSFARQSKGNDGIPEGRFSNEEEQQTIKNFEEQLEKLKKKLRDTKAYNKDTKTRIEELIQELEELQERVYTLDYVNEFSSYLLGEGIQKNFTADSLDEYVSSEEFLEKYDYFSKDFKRWFERNHFVGYKKIGDSYESYWKPTLLWTRVVAKNPNDYWYLPKSEYYRRKIRKQFETTKQEGVNIDKLGNWLPKEFRSEKWNNLSPKKKELLKQVTDFYLENQKGMWENAPGLRVPSVSKKGLEAGYFKDLWDGLFNRKNRFEEGEGNVEELKPKNFKESFKERFNEVVTKISNIFETGTLGIKKVRTGFNGEVFKEIPYGYTAIMDPEEVTDDIVGAVSLFVTKKSETKAHIAITPFYNIVDRFLDTAVKDPTKVSYSKDLNGNEQNAKLKGNTRLDRFREFVDMEVYGDNRAYEATQTVDQALNATKRITSFVSQSILSPVNNTKNYLAGSLNNLIQSYISTKSWREAQVRSKSYFQFMSQMTNEAKGFDFQLIKLFNIGNLDLSSADMYNQLRMALRQNLDIIKYLGQGLGEFAINNQIVYGVLLDTKVKHKGKVKSLLEALEENNKGISNVNFNVEGIEYNGREMTKEDLINLKLKMSTIRTNVQGLPESRSIAERYTIWNAVQFFRRYLIPALYQRFQTKRLNLMLETQQEGYYITAIKLLSAYKGNVLAIYKEFNNLTPLEQVNALRFLKELAVLMSILLIQFLLGYDEDDPDKNRKIRERNNSFAGKMINHLLLQTIMVYNEISSLSALPYGSGYLPSVYSETLRNVTTTTILMGKFKQIRDLIDSFLDILVHNEQATYSKNMPYYNIKTGDYKFVEKLQKFTGFDIGSPIIDNGLVNDLNNPAGRIYVLHQIMNQ